jgi:hypothetical protein
MGQFLWQGLVAAISGITMVFVGLASLMPLVQDAGKLFGKKMQTAIAKR